MSRISIAIIHNRDPVRLAHILPAARSLVKHVGGSVFEVCEQPAVKPHGVLFVLYKWTLFSKLARDWERYRGVKQRGLMRSLADYAVLVARKVKRRHRVISAVESIIISKHVSAWRSFLTGGADYLVVLEDDATVVDNSIDRFRALLELLNSRDPGRLLYVDLAGGFDIDGLRVSPLIEGRQNGYIYFEKLVTNTTCGYLICRETARRFCEIMASRPWFRHTPIDWLINAIGMRACAEGNMFDCRHADPPIFRHGSLMNLYTSWQREVGS